MEVIGIVLSLFLLMFFAYRGFSVILFAPIFALLAASTSGLPLMPAYSELFMTKAAIYFKSFFPVFMLGAVFGKLMEDSGLAKSIAKSIITSLGKERAILAVVLACTALTYGGVSLFVVVFAVYPFACQLFKQADIPKRLLPGTIALGAFTATMDAFPGTPQIQNLIPTNFFGTNIYAAPILGTLGGLAIYCLGLLYLNYRRKAAQAKGEGYGNHTTNEPQDVADESASIPWYLAMLPLLAVLVVNFIMSKMFTWDPSLITAFTSMKLPLIAPAVKNVIGIWALIIALVCGIILTILIGRSNLKDGGMVKALNAGTIGSLLAIMNTSSEVGYGNVIASLSGFKSISAALMSIGSGGNPLFSEAITVNVLAGVTGSASGGMSIALDLMAKHWMEMAAAVNMSPEILHRVASMASGGMDTLPHNGAVITLLAVCGMTHRQSYPDIFAMTCLKTIMVFAVVIIHSITGIL